MGETALKACVRPPACQGGNALRHGHARKGGESPTWISWQSMLSRCRYLDRDKEAKYARRGIDVCERWLSFENFLDDMGVRPAGTTLDRANNDHGYAPENCRWATPTEQARNRRNARLTFETATEVALAYLRGEPAASIAARYRTSLSLPREVGKGRSWKDASALAHQIFEKEQANG